MAETCSSCGAPILWARTRSGKTMPIDAAPVDGGNVLLVPSLDGEVTATVTAPGDGDHRSHFASCPYADSHRRDRG